MRREETEGRVEKEKKKINEGKEIGRGKGQEGRRAEDTSIHGF